MNAIKRVAVVSAIGIASIATYEGLRTNAYLDPVGIPTICYGYTKNVALGITKTKSECVFLLETEIKDYTKYILRVHKGPISQDELDAYVSFTYNVGKTAFRNSTLFKKLSNGDRIGACNELKRWIYAKGKIFAGLVERRKAENQVCLKGVYEDMA